MEEAWAHLADFLQQFPIMKVETVCASQLRTKPQLLTGLGMPYIWNIWQIHQKNVETHFVHD